MSTPTYITRRDGLWRNDIVSLFSFLLSKALHYVCLLEIKFWAPSVSKDFPSLEEAAHLLFLHLLFSFFKKLCIGVYPVNNVVIVSGEE